MMSSSTSARAETGGKMQKHSFPTREFSKEGEEYVPAFSVKVEDTVGAGDVYNAGFISGRLAGMNLRECLIRGNAVSGYTVMRKGARNSPNTEELEAFLAENK